MSSNPSLLAQPVLQSRDQLLGRRSRRKKGPFADARVASGTTMTGTAATEATRGAVAGGASLLDELQRRVQSSIYRFWAIISLSYGAAVWGSASHALYHSETRALQPDLVDVVASSSSSSSQAVSLPIPDPGTVLLDVLTYPNLDPSTAVGVALFGTTLALWNLQRSHSRLAKRFLNRDVMNRMPQIALAEVSTLSETLARDVVFKPRSQVGQVLGQWVEAEEAKRRKASSFAGKREA